MSNPQREIVRDLARRYAEIAHEPIQAERIAVNRDLNDLKPNRPVILASPEGAWRELLPDQVLQCTDDPYRQMERTLRMRIMWHEQIGDDHPWLAEWPVPIQIDVGDYGLTERRYGGQWGGEQAWHWEPALQDWSDFDKLHVPTIAVNRERTERLKTQAEEILGDILTVKEQCGFAPPSGQFPNRLIMFRGLDGIMMDMYDHPEKVHRLNELLLKSAMAHLDYLQAEGALRLNNGPMDYCGTGGVGVTSDLPADDYKGRAVRGKDLWGLSESQEFVGVSPAMFKEFAIDYQAKLMARYGLTYYGCCEPLHMHLDNIIDAFENLRSVSISPWCDVKQAFEKIQDKYCFMYKPNPAMLATNHVDWDAVQRVLTETLEITRGGRVAIILKDTHTFNGDVSRPGKWVRLARRLAESVWG